MAQALLLPITAAGEVTSVCFDLLESEMSIAHLREFVAVLAVPGSVSYFVKGSVSRVTRM